MNCGEVALRLATYRDLDAYEQAEVQLHLQGCPSCQAMFETFMRQDRLLQQSLPEARLSREFEDKVWARIHPRRRGWVWAWQPVAAALLVVMLLAGFVGGTVYASAGALPGDTLYPIKRLNEQIQLTFTFGETRARLREELAERRREEARQVLEQKRRARWQFEGVLEQAAGTTWLVDGVEVHFCEGEPTPPAAQSGAQVHLEVESLGERICVREARILRQPQPTPTEDLFPVGRPSPTHSPSPTSPVATTTPTPAPTWTPTVVGPSGAPAGKGGQSLTPLPQPTDTPGHLQTPTPRPTPRPTRTPSVRTTLQPVTPTATPEPTRTRPWATVRPATPRPTRTPPFWWHPTPTATHRPTRTPRPWVTVRPPRPTPTPSPQDEPTATPRPTRTRPWATARPPKTPTPTPTPTRGVFAPTPTPTLAKPTPTWTRPTPTPTPWTFAPTPTPTSAKLPPTPTPTPGTWDSPLPTPLAGTWGR